MKFVFEVDITKSGRTQSYPTQELRDVLDKQLASLFERHFLDSISRVQVTQVGEEV